jgi:hypothetical protein
VWVRLIWKPLFQVLIDARRGAGQDVPPLFGVMKRVWELLERAMLPLLDRRGTAPDIPDLQRRAIEFVDYVDAARLDSVRVFSAAYVTISFHQLAHMPLMVIWWGNIWEYWCFVFERIAGVYTQLLRRFNDRGELSTFLFNRLALRDISGSQMRHAKDSLPCANALELCLVRQQALIDTIAVPDGPVDEGQMWSDWQSTGMLRSRVLAPYALNLTGRQDRGLVVTELVVAGTAQEWQRINLLSIDRISLISRTLAQVRRDPWSFNAMGSERRLCGVLVDLGGDAGLEVLLVDGGAKLVAGDLDWSGYGGPLTTWPDRSGFGFEVGQWELVGCLLGAPTIRTGDTCQKVTLPTGGEFRLCVFPVSSLRRLIGLMRSSSDDLECLVVHPNEHFLMIPLTPGVMRKVVNAKGRCAKTVEFMGFDSIARSEAASVDDHREDQITFDDDPDGWSRGLPEVAGELGITPGVVKALQMLSAIKPEYSQLPGIPYANVCKELCPTGVAKAWNALLEWRLGQGLSITGLRFVDLGSGIGGVVLATLLLMPDTVAFACGVERDTSLHETMQQWLRGIDAKWPWLQHCTQLLEANMIHGDFIRDRCVVELLQTADVVFVNNYLFDPPTGCDPGAGVSLNQKLKTLLCEHLSPDATLVTTASLNESRTGSKRARGQQARMVVTHKTFKLRPSDVSWHGNLSVHIASIQ